MNQTFVLGATRQEGRQAYAPEMEVNVDYYGGSGLQYDVSVYVQYAPKRVRECQTLGVGKDHVSMRTLEGEPCLLDIEGPRLEELEAAKSEEWWVQKRLPVLKLWFGDFAEDFIAMLLEVINQRVTSSSHDEFLFIFNDAVDYYRMFFAQCQFICDACSKPFDPVAKQAEWREMWTRTDGEFNVPGQRRWYAERLPEYDEESRKFEALIAANLAALDIFEQELVTV